MQRGNPSKVFHYHSWEKTVEQVKVKLEKNSKGFNWEVSYSGDDADAVLKTIQETNEKLQVAFGGDQP